MGEHLAERFVAPVHDDRAAWVGQLADGAERVAKVPDPQGRMF